MLWSYSFLFDGKKTPFDCFICAYCFSRCLASLLDASRFSKLQAMQTGNTDISLLAASASFTKRAFIIFSSSDSYLTQLLQATKSSGLASSSSLSPSTSGIASAYGCCIPVVLFCRPMEIRLILLFWVSFPVILLLRLAPDLTEFPAAPTPPAFSISCWARSLFSLVWLETLPSTSTNFFLLP